MKGEKIMSYCKMYITEQEWNEQKKDFKEPNYDLVRAFLKKESPEYYDFKLESNVLKDVKKVLLRELTFKKNPNGFDPDCTELCMSLQCVLLESKGLDVKGYNGRSIVVFRNGKYEILETDTINSFWSLYKRALMTEVPGYTEKCKELQINGSLKDNLHIVISNIQEGGALDIAHYESNPYKVRLAAEIVIFAVLTHSIGNFMVGPNGFNCKDDCSKAKLFSNRNWSSFDRIDLFLASLDKSAHQDWCEWFSKNIEMLDMEMYFEESESGSRKNRLIDLGGEDLLSRIRRINYLIEKRGVKMVAQLTKYMESR